MGFEFSYAQAPPCAESEPPPGCRGIRLRLLSRKPFIFFEAAAFILTLAGGFAA